MAEPNEHIARPTRHHQAASGSVGTGRVARAEPGGYTLGYGTMGTHVINRRPSCHCHTMSREISNRSR